MSSWFLRHPPFIVRLWRSQSSSLFCKTFFVYSDFLATPVYAAAPRSRKRRSPSFESVLWKKICAWAKQFAASLACLYSSLSLHCSRSTWKVAAHCNLWPYWLDHLTMRLALAVRSVLANSCLGDCPLFGTRPRRYAGVADPPAFWKSTCPK